MDIVYDSQAVIGLKGWSEFARWSGALNVQQFSSCVDTIDLLRSIERTGALARQVGVTGTPGVVVDGWLLPAPPTAEQLRLLSEGVESGLTGSELIRRVGYKTRAP